MDDLFADFDPETVAAIAAANTVEREQMGAAKAQRTHTRHQMRRATAEKHLADILPPVIDDGDSWHVISRGDVDALSYLQHCIAAMPFDHVALSTWCMATPDMQQLAAWLDAGRIDQLDLYLGEIFPSQYGDEYAAALKLVDEYGARLVICKNHSKVILAANQSESCYLSIAGSANVNTNPRIEQTTITHDRALYDFYREFFDGLRSIDKRPPR